LKSTRRGAFSTAFSPNPFVMKKTLLVLAATLVAMSSAPAALIQFDLIGTAGPGMLAGSEPSLTNPSTGSGGEINSATNGFGIYYNDVTLQLHVNVGWGSGNGFSDLNAAANNSHIHGPTANNNGNGFTQTAGVLFNLARNNSTANAGFISTVTPALTAGQVTDLFNGKWYVNVHTTSNTGGEIRGFLVAVPEPSTYALGALGCLGLLALRLRRKN
jgi:hypothetical protein